MPQPLATPHARRISRYTQAQVTPAPQPLVSEIDLTRLTRKLPQRTHHRTREIVNVLPDLAIDPKPPDIPPTSAPGSFSLVDLTGAAPTPDLTDLAPSPESPAPVDHHYVSLVEMRLPSIAAIADEIKTRRSGVADVLGALRITFEPSLSKEFFPERFAPVEGVHRVPRYRLHHDYAEHLLEVMKLTSDSLNAFLLASGSQRSFTFGSSAFFEDQAFEDLLHYEWVTVFVARRFEQQVLRQL